MIYLHCTKKLRDFIGQPIEENPREHIALFSWYAHLITVNRRKMLVLINANNRFPLIMYGLKKKDVHSISKTIQAVIQRTFSTLGVDATIINAYLQEAKEVVLLPATDRSIISQLNQACTRAKHFAEESNLNLKSEITLLEKFLQHDIGTKDTKVIFFLEEMLSDLSLYYKKRAIRCRAISMRVILELEELSAWRHIVVPEHHTFAYFHHILQEAFGWNDYHLHEFICYKEKRPLFSIGIADDEFAEQTPWEYKDEQEVLLADFLHTMDKIEYMYDFGDGWRHTIEVLKTVEDYDKTYPTCLAGEGNTPPEDVGGPGGYQEFLKIIADPKHPEYSNIVEWGQFQLYQEFSLEETNWALRRL